MYESGNLIAWLMLAVVLAGILIQAYSVWSVRRDKQQADEARLE